MTCSSFQTRSDKLGAVPNFKRRCVGVVTIETWQACSGKGGGGGTNLMALRWCAITFGHFLIVGIVPGWFSLSVSLFWGSILPIIINVAPYLQ